VKERGRKEGKRGREEREGVRASEPNEPTSMEASSERMSPNMFPQTIVSNCFGYLISCIAQLSMYMCESSTVGPYSFAVAITTSLQSCETSKTFA
jgi:hypothetical protein